MRQREDNILTEWEPRILKYTHTLFFHQNNEEHLLILERKWAGHHLWVQRWLISSICAGKVLLQWGQNCNKCQGFHSIILPVLSALLYSNFPVTFIFFFGGGGCMHGHEQRPATWSYLNMSAPMMTGQCRRPSVMILECL